MVYSTESAKWKAYQFSDPFAAGSFLVCNKTNKLFCRPDCDARPPTGLKSEIEYAPNGTVAINLGYIPCLYCDPLSSPTVNVNLLLKCVVTVNNQIGFLHPFVDENEGRNPENLKACIHDSKKANMNPVMGTSVAPMNNDENDGLSSPVLNFEGKGATLSKNDSDHYKLVDLACRHLALAAAMNIYQPQGKGSNSAKDTSETISNSKKRRRRGGVLGFKELAAKSKLSAWHFHRVFKSVTGLTPKTYGDKCWEFIKNYKEANGDQQIYIGKQSSSPSSANTSPIQTPPSYQTPVSSTFTHDKPSSSASTSPDVYDEQPPSKKIKIEPSYWIGKSTESSNIDSGMGLELSHQPPTTNTFNIITPEASSIPFNNEAQNRFNSSITHLPNDINLGFITNFDVPNNQDLFQEGFENEKSTYNRVLSAPNLSTDSKFPGSLFEQPQVLAGPTEFVESLKQEIESPIISEISTSIDEILNDTTTTKATKFDELVVDMNSDHFYEFQKFVDDGVDAQCFKYIDMPQEEYNMNTHANPASVDLFSMNERNDGLNNQDIGGIVGLSPEKLTTHFGY